MTLEEIEASLPNGFHDAVLCKINADYEGRVADLRINVDVSTEGRSPIYRQALVILRGLEFLAVDSSPSGSQRLGSGLRIDAGPGQPSTSPLQTLDVPTGAFAHWFFVSPWNAFVRVVAREAELRWCGDPAATSE
jgi:hypothetical protein